MCKGNHCKDKDCSTEIRQFKLMQMLSQEKISVKPIKIDNDFKEGKYLQCA